MTRDAIGVRLRQWALNFGIKWVAATAMFAALAAAGSAATAAATPMQLTYQVTHSVFGNIGTYTNTIQPAAGGTTVQTRAHFEVKMLGVNMYREDAQRTERWQGNRLISFNGVTSKGDQSMVVKGEARGNSFVIELAARDDHRPGLGTPRESLVPQLPQLKHDDAARQRQDRTGSRQRRARSGHNHRRQTGAHQKIRS